MRQSLFLAGCLAALSACPKSPKPTLRAMECNELCVRYLNENDLVKAEIQCDLGLQFSEDYADLWSNKGIIALRLGHDEKAKAHFIKALRLNQNHAQAYNNLGHIYLKSLQYGKALDNFQRSLKVNPDFLDARYNLGLTYMGMKNLPAARKEFLTLTEVDPRLADPHAQLGVIAMEEKEPEIAVKHFRAAVERDPGFKEAWSALGNAYMEAGKACDAREAYTACLEADRDFAECRNNVAIANRKCAIVDPVVKDAQAATEGKKTASSEYALALTLKEKGLTNEEERAYKRCLRFDAKFPLCHFGLFEIFRSERRDKDANAACKNFLKYGSAEDFPRQTLACKNYLGGDGE